MTVLILVSLFVLWTLLAAALYLAVENDHAPFARWWKSALYVAVTAPVSLPHYLTGWLLGHTNWLVVLNRAVTWFKS